MQLFGRNGGAVQPPKAHRGESKMPFKSSKQARFLANQHSSIFRKFIRDSKDKTKIERKKPKNKYTEILA